jgi:hypothetical protein
MELRETLSRLGVKEREALLLHALGGLTTEELSRLQGCSVEAMRKRVQRAQSRMRHYLLGDDDESAVDISADDLVTETFRLLDEAINTIPTIREKQERAFITPVEPNGSAVENAS